MKVIDGEFVVVSVGEKNNSTGYVGIGVAERVK